MSSISAFLPDLVLKEIFSEIFPILLLIWLLKVFNNKAPISGNIVFKPPRPSANWPITFKISAKPFVKVIKNESSKTAW